MANENETVRLMSLQEVAAAMHVSPHTVRSWTKSGRLNPTRICRRLLFDPAHVQQFVRASQSTVRLNGSPDQIPDATTAGKADVQ